MVTYSSYNSLGQTIEAGEITNGTITNVKLNADAHMNGTITIAPHSYDAVIQGTWAFAQNAIHWGYNSFRNSTSADADELNYNAYFPKGTYTCHLICTHDSNKGIAKVYIGADLVATFDMYAGAGAVALDEQTAISITTPGVYTIRLVIDGKNGSSSDYYADYQLLEFHRTA